MPLTFKHAQLPNGLTIVAEETPEAHTGAVGFFVKAGSRDETADIMGVSHFLEHMMFKGSARRTADDVNREFDEIGANYNAFTSQEMTVYYAHVLPEFLPRAIDLLGDMLRPALREDDFNMEKNVILEEIGMYDDRPEWRLQDTIIETHFNRHTLGFRVLGTKETVGGLPVAAMRDYFAHRYSPDNITVAASGKIDFDKLVDDIAAVAGNWQPTGASRAYQSPEPSPREVTLSDPKLARHYVAWMVPGPSVQDPARYPAKVLADVLGDSDGSRLYWALIDTGLAEEADFAVFPQDQTGSFFAFASCMPARAKEVEQILLATIASLRDSIDPGEVERVKNKLATQITLQGENPAGRMRGLGSDWCYLQTYEPLDEKLQKIMAVTPDDLTNLQTTYPFTTPTIVRLGPTA